MAPRNPVVNAMLACDGVHLDPGTGKHTLLGVFDAVAPSGYPSHIDSAAIYVSLTNMKGAYAFELSWLRGDTEEELALVAAVHKVRVSSPLERLVLSFDVDSLPLPVPGRFILRLRVNGRHIQDYAIIAWEVTRE
jgi:hypothetical protein